MVTLYEQLENNLYQGLIMESVSKYALKYIDKINKKYDWTSSPITFAKSKHKELRHGRYIVSFYDKDEKRLGTVIFDPTDFNSSSSKIAFIDIFGTKNRVFIDKVLSVINEDYKKQIKVRSFRTKVLTDYKVFVSLNLSGSEPSSLADEKNSVMMEKSYRDILAKHEKRLQTKKEKTQLDESIQNMIQSVANGLQPADVRPKSLGNSATTKLISKLQTIKNSAFVQKFQDNGTVMVYTFGRLNRPSFDLAIQRRNNIATGIKSTGIIKQSIVNGTGEKIKGTSVTLLQVTDKSAVYGYTSQSNKLTAKMNAEVKDVPANAAAGVELTDENVDDIVNFVKVASKQNSAQQIINLWAELVNSQSDKQDQQ